MAAVFVTEWATEPSVEDLERLFEAVLAIEPGPGPVLDPAAHRSQPRAPGGTGSARLARRLTGPGDAPAEPEAITAPAPPAVRLMVVAVPAHHPLGHPLHLAPRPSRRQRAARFVRCVEAPLRALWLWWSVPAIALVVWGASKEAAAAGGAVGLILAGAVRLARAHRPPH